MTKQASRRVGVIAFLAVAGSGCEIIADFDRTKIDGGLGEVDAAAFDGTLPEAGGGPDATQPEASPPGEAGGSDASEGGTVPDAGSDSSETDSNAADTGAADTGANDAGDGAIGLDAADGATE